MKALQWLLLCFSLLSPLSLFASTPIDINTADATTLSQVMKGVGETKAAAIIAYRDQNGPFKSVDDLAMVQGIGQKTVDDNRELLSVGAAGKSAK
jgi:competence protein ComEA